MLRCAIARRLRLAVASIPLLVLSGSAQAASQKARQLEQHTVQEGDTLWELAHQRGCTVDAVQKANDLEGDTLRVGSEILLPTCEGTGSKSGSPLSIEHRIEPGDTLAAIARRHDTTVEAIQRLNGLENTIIVVGKTLQVPTKTPQIRFVAGQSVGRPHRGKLVDGVQLPHDRAYYRRRPDSAWGAQHVIDHIRAVVTAVRRSHPKVHRLAIGDISARDGGRIIRHASHQSGRDVDLGLYFQKVPQGYPEEFVRAGKAELDLKANWALLKSLYEASKKPGGPEKVFLDYAVQGRLYEHAKKNGATKRELAEIFQYPKGRWARKRFVQHEPHHADHLHVRFACPPKDKTCK